MFQGDLKNVPFAQLLILPPLYFIIIIYIIDVLHEIIKMHLNCNIELNIYKPCCKIKHRIICTPIPYTTQPNPTKPNDCLLVQHVRPLKNGMGNKVGRTNVGAGVLRSAKITVIGGIMCAGGLNLQTQNLPCSRRYKNLTNRDGKR